MSPNDSPSTPGRDPLTGLFSRAEFEAQYGQQLRRCGRTATTLGMVLLRVDRFRRLSGSYGTGFGDEVLLRVAGTLQRVVRATDILARYGNAEFALLALRPTEKGMAKVSGRIRAAVQSTEISCGGGRLPVTVSGGAAVALPGREPAALHSRLRAAAEQALREAKQAGGNRICLRSLLTDDERRLAQRVCERRLSRWLVDRSVLDVQSLSQALVRYEGGASRIGELALQHGAITREQIGEVVRLQQHTQRRFGATAIELGVFDEDRLVRLLALQQEDPLVLARVLVRMGLLERRQAAELLADYMAEVTSDRLIAPASLS
jgi:diguanylate cyclase (GGDEF)-like protein